MRAGERSRKQTVSGVAGASGGTGLMGLAGMLPDNYMIVKNILIYSSPSASILFGFLWAYAMAIAVSKAQKSRMNKALAEARKVRDEIVNNPHSSEKHKKTVQANVEELERLNMELITGETEAVRAALK